jgi:hypothetical protein
LPSGDQVGVKSPIVLSVNCTWREPSAFMTQISKSRGLFAGVRLRVLQEKTMRVPSGDHDGPRSSSVGQALGLAHSARVDHVNLGGRMVVCLKGIGTWMASEHNLLPVGRPIRIVVDRRWVVRDVRRSRSFLEEVIDVQDKNIAIRCCGVA